MRSQLAVLNVRPGAVGAWLTDAFDHLVVSSEDLPWQFPSLDAVGHSFEDAPPLAMLRNQLPDAEGDAMLDALVDVHRPYLDRLGRVAATAPYLLTTVRRQGTSG